MRQDTDHLVTTASSPSAGSDLYRFAVDRCGDAVYVVDADNRLCYANEAAEQLLGYARGGLRNVAWSEIDPRHGDGECRSVWDRARLSGSLTAESGHRTRQGATVPVSLRIHYFHAADGEFLCVLARDGRESLQLQEQRNRGLQRLQRQREAFADLAADERVSGGNSDDALGAILGAVAKALAVRRASFWMLDDAGEVLVCRCLHEGGAARPVDGLELKAGDYPDYFRAVADEHIVDAHAARSDPRTREFTEGYLRPLGITSMLDTAVRVRGDVIGVICLEHVGPPREWQSDEIAFAGSVAEQCAHVIERCRRERAETDLAKFKTISDLAGYGVVINDRDGRFLYVNEAFAGMHGYAIDELMDAGFEMCHAPEHLDEVREAFDRLQHERVFLGLHLWHRHRDGHEFQTRVNATQVRDGDGRTKYTAATFIDISRELARDEELRENRRQLNTLIASLPGMAFRIRNEPEWPVEFISEGSTELIGWRPEQIIGDREIRHIDCVHPEDRGMVWEAMQEALAEHRPYEVEYRIVTRDGETKWVWEQGFGVYADDGELLAAEGFVTDITARVQAVRDLRFKTFSLDHVDDAVLWVDREGGFLDINKTAERMYGWTREEFQSLRPADIDPEYDAAGWEEMWGALRRDGSLRKETVHQLRDGRILPVEVSARLIRFEESEFLCALVRDITVRKEAEEKIRHMNQDLEERVVERTRELKSSRERYRLLVESLRDRYIFYSLDAEDRLTYISPSVEQVLGYTPQEYRAVRGERFTDSPVNEKVAECRRAVLRGEHAPAFEAELLHRDGTPRTFEILEVPVCDEQGNVASVEGIAHDITQHKRNLVMIREQQDQLLENEKMAALGRMVAGVAHEINTPVGIGVTAASHLRETMESFQAVYKRGGLRRSDLDDFLSVALEATAMVQGNLDKAAKLIQGFKGVAVDQTGEGRRVFDLKEYVDGVLLSLRPALKKTRHEIVFECPADIQVDNYPGALSQALTNLVMNSLIHGFPEGRDGRITIRASQREGKATLVYADDGVGMTPEVRRQLYEPFFTTRRGRGGSGLGMHVVYTSVTQTLGGTIACESSPDNGTVFTIMFPTTNGSRDDGES